MSSINPTVKLAKIRSDIDDTQSKLSMLEMILTNLLSLAFENKDSLSAVGKETIAEINEDFQLYAANRGDLSEEDREDLVTTLINDTHTVVDNLDVEIPPELLNRDELADAWVEFAESSEDPAVVRVAITNLKASLGALRNEETAWREQGQHEQKMVNETSKLAQI
ncbi:MAG: hypothetical protein HRT47_08905 [Candidatus Caenarcaniphilales bacterium]|nr:hypothetical protein [Candidatus Caenarcaniphilales bacterium]